jgi:peptidoglycan/xylan/chitin deacetylase (PgdA/CDA1 family)
VHRRTFLGAALLGATPTVLGAGLGTAVVRASEDEDGRATAADSGPGLGTQRILWSGAGAVALTFDDGPDPDLTPRLLDLLATRGVPATLLLIGTRVHEHPDLVRRAVDAGHELGNHTWSHRSLATLDRAEVRRELERTNDVVPTPMRWFRPPDGVLTGAGAQVAAELGYDVLLWSCSASPRSLRTPAEVATHVEEHLRPGTVLCMHDGLGRAGFSRWRRTVDAMRKRRAMELSALPRILDEAKDRGVRFVTASQLAG